VLGLVDASGHRAATYTYDPLGKARTTTQTYRFQGTYLDPTGLYKMGTRYYGPTIGRFTQTDPSGKETNPYLAFGADPVNHTDPNGTFSLGGSSVTSPTEQVQEPAWAPSSARVWDCSVAPSPPLLFLRALKRAHSSAASGRSWAWDSPSTMPDGGTSVLPDALHADLPDQIRNRAAQVLHDGETIMAATAAKVGWPGMPYVLLPASCYVALTDRRVIGFLATRFKATPGRMWFERPLSALAITSRTRQITVDLGDGHRKTLHLSPTHGQATDAFMHAVLALDHPETRR
jgi:RHS repeat-associated protein